MRWPLGDCTSIVRVLLIGLTPIAVPRPGGDAENMIKMIVIVMIQGSKYFSFFFWRRRKFVCRGFHLRSNFCRLVPGTWVLFNNKNMTLERGGWMSSCLCQIFRPLSILLKIRYNGVFRWTIVLVKTNQQSIQNPHYYYYHYRQYPPSSTIFST